MEKQTNKKAESRGKTEAESPEKAETVTVQGPAGDPTNAAELQQEYVEPITSNGKTVHAAGGNGSRESEPSNSKLTLERVKMVRDELRSKGHAVTQRNILKQLGGSFSTVSKLLNRLEALESEPFDITITVADATAEAIKADIRRHVEIYMKSVQDKVAKVEESKSDLLEAKQTIESQQETIAELLETITHLEIKISVLEGFNKAA